MKIGIIGSGNMGRALGVRLAGAGHDLFFGARREGQAAAAAARAGHGARAGSNEDAAAFGDVLLWTMREPDPTAVLADVTLLEGKVVLDVNNRDYGAARDGRWFEASLGERLQAAAPGAKVAKAFNTIAMEAFDTSADALRASGAQTFLAGNAEAKAVAKELAESLGFAAVDAGASPFAMRAVEALADVVRLLMIDGGRGGRAHLVLAELPAPNLGAIGDRERSAYGRTSLCSLLDVVLYSSHAPRLREPPLARRAECRLQEATVGARRSRTAVRRDSARRSARRGEGVLGLPEGMQRR